MMKTVAQLHVLALPHTISSRMGVGFVRWLYTIISKIGFVELAERDGRIVGAMSRIGKLILTLVVDPEYQRKGIGSGLIAKKTGELWVYTEKCSVDFYRKIGFKEVFKIGKIIVLCKK